MTISGVDVSRAQSPERCNWAAAVGSGLHFVLVKGSEGAGGAAGAYVDPAAAEHLTRIRRTPLFVGMYHVARPDNRFRSSSDGFGNGCVEAKHAIATATDLGVVWYGSLPIVLDLEKYVPADLNTTVEQRDDFVRGLVATIWDVQNRLPIVYTGATYWKYQHSSELARELRDRGVLLWQVDYTRAADPGEAIAGWPWTIWQHSGGGQFAYADPIPGLPHPIDQNVYRGSVEELRGLVTG